MVSLLIPSPYPQGSGQILCVRDAHRWIKVGGGVSVLPVIHQPLGSSEQSWTRLPSYQNQPCSVLCIFSKTNGVAFEGRHLRWFWKIHLTPQTHPTHPQIFEASQGSEEVEMRKGYIADVGAGQCKGLEMGDGALTRKKSMALVLHSGKVDGEG